MRLVRPFLAVIAMAVTRIPVAANEEGAPQSTRLAKGNEFTRNGIYKSPEEFVECVKRFQPKPDGDILSFYFHALEQGQLEDPKTFSPVWPSRIENVTLLWKGSGVALAFAVAEPRTTVTRSAVGVAFVLSSGSDGWRISSIRRWVAQGKYAEVHCQLTSAKDSDIPILEESEAIFTVTKTDGGRGFSASTSASFGILNGNIIVKTLGKE
jgi:hypothetical protein